MVDDTPNVKVRLYQEAELFIYPDQTNHIQSEKPPPFNSNEEILLQYTGFKRLTVLNL
jgi:hypothetical protein